MHLQSSVQPNPSLLELLSSLILTGDPLAVERGEVVVVLGKDTHREEEGVSPSSATPAGRLWRRSLRCRVLEDNL